MRGNSFLPRICGDLACPNHGKLSICSKCWSEHKEEVTPARELVKESLKVGENMQESDGGSTNYYKLPTDAVEIQDLIEFKEMNFSLGNIMKAVWRLGSKKGATKSYDLRKIIWYASRELAREEGKFYRLVECSKDEFHK